jgi:hypothetical protein
MRKNLTQTTPGYLLGKQMKESYLYSNGRLRRDAHSQPAIWRPSIVRRIEKFLSEGANGPEHQALRHWIETSARMATILIAYDIHPTEGEMYDDLIERIQSLGDWWHHLESAWIVRCAHSPREIRDQLKSSIGTDDRLLVLEISGDTAEWAAVNDAGSQWLKDNI